MPPVEKRLLPAWPCAIKGRISIEESNMKNQIDIVRLREVLHYNADTGVLTWRVNRRRERVGAEAGRLKDSGYRVVDVNGRGYRSHRIAWALHHGEWPKGDIDHIDGVKTNNRIANLRDVSTSVNMQNRKRAQANNRSGSSVPGVSFHKETGKFEVRAIRGGRRVYVGLFANISEAESASLAYRRLHYAGNTL